MSGSERVTRYMYDPVFDCLYLDDLSPIELQGRYTNGMTLTEQQGVGFVICINERRDGCKCSNGTSLCDNGAP